MRFKRVLLVSPPSSSRYGGLRVPAGIGYVVQALHDSSIQYDYIDMRIGYTFDDLKRKVRHFAPDLVGIGMITLEYKNTYRMMSAIKEVSPEVKIVVGGHHMTILKEAVLEECGAVDFGVVADGEKAIVELCEGKLPLEEIRGLVYRKNGSPFYVGERPPVEDLDAYAFPRFEGFNLRDYSRQIPIHSSRGCVYKCTFCPNKVIARKYRTRSPKSFVDEIQHWYERGYRQFAIDDDNFTFNRQRVYEICDEIERRGLKGLFIRCSNGLRADRVDRDLLGRMKEIGVREVGFGVDGGNDKMLGHLKKGEKIASIESAIKTACELGLDVKLFFLFGTPFETREDIEDSIRLARKYPVARVNFNNPIPYPGTEMYEYVRDNNLLLVPPEEYLNNVAEDKYVPIFETPELPKKERIEMFKRCRKVEREVMKNTAVRMFSRYPLAKYLIRVFFNVGLFERLFFKNLAMRKYFEWMRYRNILGRQRS